MRASRGRVDEVTWSKVQGGSAVVAETQAYALRQIEAVAEKLEKSRKVGAVAEVLDDSTRSVQEWLAVLARTFELQDGLTVLELDRVLDAAPGEVEGHRRGLMEARDRRVATIATTTESLLRRVDEAVALSDDKVVLHPLAAKSVVWDAAQVGHDLVRFRSVLGCEESGSDFAIRCWRQAVADARDRALDAGTDGLRAAARLGSEATDRVRSTAQKMPKGLATPWRRAGGVGNPEEATD